MSEDEHTLLLLRGAVASLPKEDQDKVKLAYDRVRAVIEEVGPMTILAIGLIAAEEAARDFSSL